MIIPIRGNIKGIKPKSIVKLLGAPIKVPKPDKEITEIILNKYYENKKNYIK